MKKRPDIVTDEHLEFLDDLREMGTINMFGARPNLIAEFGLPKKDAAEILTYWMESFGERQK